MSYAFVKQMKPCPLCKTSNDLAIRLYKSTGYNYVGCNKCNLYVVTDNSTDEALMSAIHKWNKNSEGNADFSVRNFYSKMCARLVYYVITDSKYFAHLHVFTRLLGPVCSCIDIGYGKASYPIYSMKLRVGIGVLQVYYDMMLEKFRITCLKPVYGEYPVEDIDIIESKIEIKGSEMTSEILFNFLLDHIEYFFDDKTMTKDEAIKLPDAICDMMKEFKNHHDHGICKVLEDFRCEVDLLLHANGLISDPLMGETP